MRWRRAPLSLSAYHCLRDYRHRHVRASARGECRSNGVHLKRTHARIARYFSPHGNKNFPRLSIFHRNDNDFFAVSSARSLCALQRFARPARSALSRTGIIFTYDSHRSISISFSAKTILAAAFPDSARHRDRDRNGAFYRCVIMFSSLAADNRDLAGVIFHVASREQERERERERERENSRSSETLREELNLATAKAARAFARRAVYLHLRSNFHDFISG